MCGQVHVVLSGGWEEPGPVNPWSLTEDKGGGAWERCSWSEEEGAWEHPPPTEPSCPP